MTAARDIPVGASVAAARPPAGGSAHQAASETPTPLAHDTGAAPSDCRCGHGTTWHRRWRECEAPGCTCWAYRKTEKNSARTGGSRPGA